MPTNEQKFETGLAVLEMARTAGWKWLEAKIRKEIDMASRELLEMEIAGATSEEIASEFLRQRAIINAFEKVLRMVEMAINEKEEAAKIMNQNKVLG